MGIRWGNNGNSVRFFFGGGSPKSLQMVIAAIKLKKCLPYDPEISLLGIHTEETRLERDTSTPVFTAAQFTTARTWKQPRRPSADEWIRKLWYTYTMGYFSAIKKKKQHTFESILMRWMKLEPIIQSEVSRKEKRHRHKEQTIGLCGRRRG